jgi:hypothetical protein
MFVDGTQIESSDDDVENPDEETVISIDSDINTRSQKTRNKKGTTTLKKGTKRKRDHLIVNEREEREEDAAYTNTHLTSTNKRLKQSESAAITLD